MKKSVKAQAGLADRIFVKVLGGEKWQGITVPLFSIVLSLLAGAILLLALGKNPLTGYLSLLQGSGLFPKGNYAAFKSILTDFTSMLNILTPMIFAALAVAVAFKGGLFNIGVSGQMLFGGFAATVLIGYSPLPAVLAKPLVIVVGMLGGALVGGLIGVLKYKFNINEVVSSIMLNYIFQYVISFVVYTYYLDPVSRQSKNVTDAARLTLMNAPVGNLKMDLPLGFILAVAVVFLVRFFLVKTRLGYEVKTVGAGINAARYAGISVGRTMVTTMVFSGALAGLAGVTYYLGYLASIQPGTLTTIGFDSIAVSLLGNSNAVGILFASLLITIITKGSTYMTSQIGVTVEIASVITGLLLLFSACGAYIRYLARRSRDRIDEAEALAKKEASK